MIITKIITAIIVLSLSYLFPYRIIITSSLLLLSLIIFISYTIPIEHAIFPEIDQIWAFLPTVPSTQQPSIQVSDEYIFVKQWGSEGAEDGKFNNLDDIAIDSSSNVYVVDSWNFRIQKFDSNGNFITKWGSIGSDDGVFDYYSDLAFDSSGNIYVTDIWNDVIHKFDRDGNFIIQWGPECRDTGKRTESKNIIIKDCEYLIDDIAIDSSDIVYIFDNTYKSNRIHKFDSNGNFITKWGSSGNGPGQFNSPDEISIDSSGNIYVLDDGGGIGIDRIQKFDNNGNFLTQWSIDPKVKERYYEDIAIDSSGNVYVLDRDGIKKFDGSGNLITKWCHNDGRNIDIDDSSGNVYVTNSYSIWVYTPSSNLLDTNLNGTNNNSEDMCDSDT